VKILKCDLIRQPTDGQRTISREDLWISLSDNRGDTIMSRGDRSAADKEALNFRVWIVATFTVLLFLWYGLCSLASYFFPWGVSCWTL